MSAAPPGSGNRNEMERHLRESGRLVETIQAYLEQSMQDGQEAVDALTAEFGGLYSQIQRQQSDKPSSSQEEIIQQLRQAIIHLQFYDRLFQRVEHIQTTLHDYHF